MQKIVVFMHNRNFFGAQIVHIPLLKKLKEKYPDSHITLFSKSQISHILIELGVADTLITETKKIKTLLEYIKQNAFLSINLRKNSFFTSFIISLFNFNRKIGFHNTFSNLFFTKTAYYDDTIYRAQNYLNLIGEKLTYEPVTKNKEIIIIPGAGGKFKEWSINNYIKLAILIKEKYPLFTLHFILGKNEQHLLDKIPDGFSILYDLDVKKLYDVIIHSSLVIANDCGPSHIAQINDVKTLILVSDEYNNAQKVVKEWVNKPFIIGKKQENIQSITLEDVWNRVYFLLQKSQ